MNPRADDADDIAAANGGPAIQDHIDYRRHRNACKYYREDWRADDALYRCICLLDMPPETLEEQELCLKSRRGCWRFRVANALGTSRGQATEAEDQEVTA